MFSKFLESTCNRLGARKNSETTIFKRIASGIVLLLPVALLGRLPDPVKAKSVRCYIVSWNTLGLFFHLLTLLSRYFADDFSLAMPSYLVCVSRQK